MGSKHKHKSKKKKHRHSPETSDQEYEKGKKKHHKTKKAYSSSDDDVVIVAPPPPKITKRSSKSPTKRHASKSPSKRRSSKSPSKRHHSPKQDQNNRKRNASSPPPAKKRRSASVGSKSPSPPPAPSIKSSSDISLSIEETNRIRAKLGLKPLETGSVKLDKEGKSNKETFGGKDMGEFVHKPADNISKKAATDKLKEKLDTRREKRTIEDRVQHVKKLADSDSDDDARKWVEKNRKVVSDREQAERRAKELDDMDEVFGIGELIEEDLRHTKRNAYTSKDLKGMKVEHSMDNFMEGTNVILTLKDKEVLDKEDDTLINVNILDDERYKKNIDRRVQKPGYNAYDDHEFDEYGDVNIEPKNLLDKYDEEIEGQKKTSFTIGERNEELILKRRQAIREKLEGKTGKRLETLATNNVRLAGDFYTEEEIKAKFKKPKKKVRKIRKPKPLTADDLLQDVKKDDPWPDHNNTNGNAHSSSRAFIKIDPDFMDIDDLPAPSEDLVTIKIEDEEEDDNDLQLALMKARKLKQMESVESQYNISKIADEIKQENASEDFNAAGSIVMNTTAEFCRTLGDIPTYGQSGNREDAQQLLEFERELMEEKKKIEKESLSNGWDESSISQEMIDVATYEQPILDAEPDIGSGVVGALKMAVSKGYIEKESVNKPSTTRLAHLQAQNYSIEDKTFTEDDKHSRRERYNGPTTDFKEKDGYKPNINLEYINDDGHLLSAKEAFRYLSHKFHGKGPGKNKIEKRLKKNEQDMLMKHMSSTDTPLGTLNMLQQKQKETQSPFVVLSGSKQGQSTSIAKLKR